MNRPVDRRFESGVLDAPRPGAVEPPEDLWATKKGGLVLVECPQRIPCDPCHTHCPTAAIRPFRDINDVPQVDHSLCTGCGLCVAACPGLACFVADLSHAPDVALMKLPCEMLPVPGRGDVVSLLDRVGEKRGSGRVIRVVQPLKDRTLVVHVEVPKNLVGEVRAIRVEVTA